MLINARYRLRQLRATAKNRNESKRWIHSDYTWKTVRVSPFKYRDTITRNNGKWFCEKPETIGEVLGDSGELIRLDYTGWYADHYQDALIKGAVIKLRSKKGVYYIPYTYCTEWDGITVYFNESELIEKNCIEKDHEFTIESVALTADRLAETEAENSREFYAKDQAEQDILNAKEYIADQRHVVKGLVKELKHIKHLPPVICETVRQKIVSAHRELRQQIKIIHKRRDNFWSSVEDFF